MGTKTALIFGAAAQADWSFLDRWRAQNLLVICADGGLLNAGQAGFVPSVFIGDCDSGGAPMEQGVNLLLPAQKDLTDLQAAYEYAVENGCKQVIMTGCTGGRQDHHLANLQLLERANKSGICAQILDQMNKITCLGPGCYRFDREDYRYFSLLPIDGVLRGVTIRHAKYALEDAVVFRGDSLTVSNETLGQWSELEIGEGYCWLVLSR